jgi:hypothetical protein
MEGACVADGEVMGVEDIVADGVGETDTLRGTTGECRATYICQAINPMMQRVTTIQACRSIGEKFPLS